MPTRDLGRREQDRLRELLDFLAHDPANKHLILDATEAALDAHNLEKAANLLEQLSSADAADSRATNLAGLVALRQGRNGDAIMHFTRLLEQNADIGPRLNLAWAHLLTGNAENVLATLEDERLATDPVALRLRVQALHHLGRLDEALALGDQAAETQIGDRALFGALSNVALDANDTERGQAYATLAADQPDGMATLGMLALGGGDPATAATLFDKALAGQPNHARARIGKGLTLLQSDPLAAATELERGAEIFATHLGSWIAAGWARFIAGDTAGARLNFERARALDDTFSEVHGGLAVLAIVDGDLDKARERMRIALRLDGQSLGGRLAQMMLLEQAGKPEASAAILRKALAAPLGPNGQTLQQALAEFTRVRS